MNPFLIPAPDNAEERWTGERCFITERLNDARVPQVSMATARVEPGTTTELHQLAVNEWYLVRRGQGLMEVGDQAPFRVTGGDTVVIPAGVAQRITNTGDDDLEFDCVCIPRFSVDCYTALE